MIEEEIRLLIGEWTALQTDASAIRYDVFVIEQNVPVELELDDMDAQCLHVVAYDTNDRAIGTARLLPDGHIGRMAVRKEARSTGIGSTLLQVLMEQARARGDRVVKLNAQLQAEAFYVRHGYQREGEEFLDAGIPHIAMQHVFNI
jgi:predicted GNAT family N-acyltransferase